MTRIQVDKNVAYILDKDIYTRGQVGAQIRFEFSNDWSNYVKVAVFVAGDVYKNIIITESGVLANVTIPWEVLTVANTVLRVGVYGSNSLGTKLVPTIWCDLGVVRDSADPIVDIDPSPDFIKQLMQVTAETKEYSDEARASAAKIENMTVHATQLPSGSLPEVIKTPGNVIDLEFRIPKGDTGAGITRISSNQSYDGRFTEIHMFLSDGSTYNTSIPNGTPGVSITSVELVSGDHTPGTYDTYNINFSDNRTPTSFRVYNGADSPVLTVNDKSPDSEGNIQLDISDLGVTTTVEELNQLHESNINAADLNKLHSIEATAEELNKLHDSDVSTADLDRLHNIESTADELNQLHESGVIKNDLIKLHDVNATANEINKLNGVVAPIQTQIDSKPDISIDGHILNINYANQSSEPIHREVLVQSSKSVIASDYLQYIKADIGYEAIGSVTINSITRTEPTLVASNIKRGITIFGITGTYSGGEIPYEPEGLQIQQYKIVIPTNEVQEITPDPDFDGIAKVIIKNAATSDPNLIPENIKYGINIFGIVGQYGIRNDITATSIQSNKIIYPDTTDRVIYPDEDYEAISMVTLESAIHSDSNLLPENIKSGVSLFDVLGTYTGSTEFIPTGVTVEIAKSANPSDHDVNVWADDGYSAMKSLFVNSVSNAEPNLIPENIKSGVTIYGIVGTYEGN